MKMFVGYIDYGPDGSETCIVVSPTEAEAHSALWAKYPTASYVNLYCIGNGKIKELGGELYDFCWKQGVSTVFSTQAIPKRQPSSKKAG